MTAYYIAAKIEIEADPITLWRLGKIATTFGLGIKAKRAIMKKTNLKIIPYY